MQPDRPRPLTARIGVTPPSAVEDRRRFHGVAAVQVGDNVLSVAWGRLMSMEPDPAALDPSPRTWTLDLETISYGKLPTQDYPVQIKLRDGRTLLGEAVLQSTNGRIFHFESRGQWTGLDEGDDAAEEAAQPAQPVAVTS